MKQKTPRDAKYLAWLRTLPCTWCKAPAPSEASHHGKHGVSSKASDYRAIPLCTSAIGAPGCHRVFTDTGKLPGSAMSGEQTLDWAAHRALDLHDLWMTR